MSYTYLLEKEIAGIPENAQERKFNESQFNREKEFNEKSSRTRA